MNVFVRFGPLIVLFASTVFLAVFWLVSIGKTTALQPGKCRKMPEVLVTDSRTVYQVIKEAIETAEKRIQFSCFYIATSDYFNEYNYIDAFEKAKKKGVDIQIVAGMSNDVYRALKEKGIDNIDRNNTKKFAFASETVVVDNAAFIARPLSGKTSLTTFIKFVDCQAGVDDILHFVKYFRRKDNSTVIPTSLTAVTSAIVPTSVGESQFFLFHTPPSYTYPLRISAETVLVDLIESNPSELRVYSSWPPMIDTNTGPGSSQFQFYLQMKKGWLMNKTRVKYLVPRAVNSTENRMWCNAMSVFNKVDLRMYEPANEGMEFILANGYSYVMTHPLKAFELNNYVALHYATNDANTWNNLSATFDTIWEQSAQYTPVLPQVNGSKI